MTKSVLKRTLTLAFFMLAVVPLMFAQKLVEVTGTVTDADGEPLIGVSVVIKGQNLGVNTDFDGHYTIKANEGATLVYTYVGCAPETRTAKAGVINVTLQSDSKVLDDVVVVGYGVQKKSSLTGAVSQVKAEDMENRTISRPEQALQGKTAGVQVFTGSAKPGAGPQVRIRGISSNGDCSPLYVVDGRIAGDIGGIDPNDIESMEVLKDGASAAIYGAAAGNGVILITTKKGKGNGKITYDFQFTSQSHGKVPHVMNSEQYINFYGEAGLLSEDIVYKNWDFKTNTDWIDVAFENSHMQRHNLAFQSGNDKSNIYVSLTYLHNDGMVSGNSDVYERLTGMINATWQIKPWLQISTNNQIERYSSRSVAEGSEYGSYFLAALTLDPLTKPTYTVEDMPDEMRNILNTSRYGYLLSDGNGNYYGISPYVSSENPNPLIMRDRAYNKSRGFNITGTTALNFMPIKGLTVTSRLSYMLSASESYGVSYDYYGNSTQKQDYLGVSASAYTPTYYQWENFANYTHNFGGKHNMTLMVGTSYSQSRSFGLSGSYQGTSEDMGFQKDDPLFHYFAYATAAAQKQLSGGEPNYGRKLAYYGRANYEYDGKYLAQFSLRADAADSSVLPKPKRWGYFPAASLGWVVSQENFMQDTRTWLDLFKVRGSWGRNGSTSSLGGYRYANVIASTGNYPTSSYEIGYVPGYAPSSTGNLDLKWETSEQTNIGFDLRLLRNRLTFTFDWFDKTTKDLIVSGITPSTVVGNTASPVNAGNITNRGVEFELGWQDRRGDFTYGVRANLATLKNKVTRIHESLDAIDGTTFHNVAITRFEVGMPAWYFYGYKFAGIDKETGDPTFVDLDGSGDITDSDKTMIGSGLPDFTYGITLNAAWKGLDLIVFGTGSQGNDIFCCLNRPDFTLNKLTLFTENRWTPENHNGDMPRAGAADMDKWMRSDASVFDGSYFKIKQIQLGYTLPRELTKKAYIDNLRVYCSLEDFFTFTKYKGFDPEVTGVGSALGVDKGSYPNSRKVVVGLNVTF